MPATRSRLPLRLELEHLEAREVPSVSSVFLSGSTLVVQCNNVSTRADVIQSGNNYSVRDLISNQTWNYATSKVAQVEFQGGAGNDDLRNNVSLLVSRFFGNAGNDYLEGYSAADVFVGGDGNDTMVGYGGDDQMWGGNGDDVLRGMTGNDRLACDAGNDTADGGSGNDVAWGGAGDDVLLGGYDNDQLVGDDGNDQLNGQMGNDSCWGGNGSDVLIAIDGATGDYLEGNAGSDIFWVDRVGSATDRIYGQESGDVVQYVSSFANGADRTLDGDRIADPTLLANMQYKRFDNPLYSSSGPRLTDIRQGSVGDCYYLAGLGGIATDNSFAIRARVVDFNDGTYGVRLGNNFYRVDNDLPVWSAGATDTAAAHLGAGGSLWVAIAEKAFAHYRSNANSYASIEGGNGWEANRAFGSTSYGHQSFSGYSSATALANDIYSRWLNFQAVSVEFYGWGSAGEGSAPLHMSHAYTVYSFQRNSSGVITGVVLRNPWGYDGAGSDSNTSDGLVTVSVSTLFRLSGAVNWGRV
jgi:hypothetical protein